MRKNDRRQLLYTLTRTRTDAYTHTKTAIVVTADAGVDWVTNYTEVTVGRPSLGYQLIGFEGIEIGHFIAQNIFLHISLFRFFAARTNKKHVK